MELNFLCKSACGRARIRPPRGPRKVLCVVVVTTSANGTGARPIDDARIGGKSGHDHFWTMLLREPFDLIVVDDAGGGDQAVLNRLEKFTREINLGPVGEVPAMIETHSQNRIAGIEQREIDRGVGLGAGMRLDVRVSRAK